MNNAPPVRVTDVDMKFTSLTTFVIMLTALGVAASH